MSEFYNRFTGQNMERLAALSDGLFAVAMTLLVLDLRVPASIAGSAYSEHRLWAALLRLGPSFAAYLLSFTMLCTFWLAQHILLGILGRCDRTLSWINLAFLFVVSLLPFSAALLARYVHFRLAVGVYRLNILLLGAGLEWAARYGRKVFVPRRRSAVPRPAHHIPPPDPARPDPVRPRGPGLPCQYTGKRDRPRRRPAVLHRLPPAATCRAKTPLNAASTCGRQGGAATWLPAPGRMVGGTRFTAAASGLASGRTRLAYVTSGGPRGAAAAVPGRRDVPCPHRG
jgi:uncharacterized membrane protein